jgi:hypothetical protein
MNGPFAPALAFCLLIGIAGTVVGSYQCIKGYTYSVAAQHESTAVGHVLSDYYGKGGGYHYEFSINGVKMDDYCDVCATPLAPRACHNNGPVLVYYAYQPFSNSLLEDFSVAETHGYRIGRLALAIGLPFLVLSTTGITILSRKDGREEDPGPEVRNRPSDVPDDLHIAPE